MPLPQSFPRAPKRPPSSVMITGPDGKVAKAWSDYFDQLDRFNEAVRARLDTF